MKKLHLLFVVLGVYILSPLAAFGHVGEGWISWYNPRLGGVEVVKLTTGEHLLLGKGSPITLEPYALEGEIEPTLALAANPFWIGDTLFAVSPGFQSVYQIDTATKVVKSIHYEYFRGNNFYATQFERGGAIFSFGGGGLWTRNVVLLTFTFKERLWATFGAVTPFEVHKQFVKMDVAEFERSMCYYDRTHDALFVVSLTDVWMYSFTDDEWTRRGKIHDKFAADLSVRQNLTDSTLLVQSDWRTYELDLYHNRWYDVTEANKSNTSNLYGIFPIPVYYPQAQGPDGLDITVLRRNENQPDQRTYLSLWHHEAGKRTDLGAFYTPLFVHWGLRGVILAVAIGLFAWSLVRLSRSKRKEEVVEQVTYPDELPELSAEELATLKALIHAPQTTDALNLLLGVDQQSDDSQRRRRSDLVRELNAMGRQYFGKDLVERTRDRTDRRIVVYTIPESMKYAANQLLLVAEQE